MCNSCEIMIINGVKCHERGCPDTWEDEQRECNWCGAEFKPTEKDQQLCSDDCIETYYNI